MRDAGCEMRGQKTLIVPRIMHHASVVLEIAA